jgi:Protein of unknown function (DUF4238)
MIDMKRFSFAKKAQQNISRENHTLPVCYQNAFTNENGELFVQFLDKDKPIPLHPRVVGKINDFYTRTINGVEDDGIERFFSTFVEGEYAAVAKRIKAEKSEFVLQPSDVATLLKFVATQIVRTQAHLDCINEQAGMKVPRVTFHHNMHRKMKMIADRWMRHTPDVILWTPLPLLRCQFVTGDNPVLCFTHDEDAPRVVSAMPKIIDLSVSLESSHNGFIVALSPYICLTVINSGKRDTITLRPAQCTDPNVVRNFNRMIYNQCVRFVAAQDPEHLKFHVKRTGR